MNQVSLSDVYWFQEGPGVRNWQFKESGIKLLNVANITKQGKIDLDKTDRHLSTEEVDSKYQHFLIDEGDLVIASSGITNDEDNLLRTKIAFIEKQHLPLCLNTSTIRFKAKDGVSDLKFLKHWLNSLEFRQQITKEVTGIAQKNFGPSHLKKIKISLPPLSEQHRIASILDQADELRQKRQQAIEKLDQLLQATFIDMFGDPVSNPKGFKTIEFSKIGKWKSGATPSKANDDFWIGKFPWVSPKDMKTDHIFDAQDHISEIVFKETNLKKIDKGHLLIVVRGMILAHSFPTAINEVPISINQDMKAIEPIDDINVVYLKSTIDAFKPFLCTRQK
ncbi:restriction endonuclease subunit S [Acinetobacter johnsonii]|uniref:restriction endonuclease subunit S n=1 Tax=Acinetobacter johnsonii TaxID=40214 RepID=UPI003D186B2D